MSRPDFYRAFEDRFRGPAQVIESRLSIYLPFVRPVADAHRGTTLTDLGCGRGEWLALLRRAGLEARGVDKDDTMLSACREQGLSVERADAIEYLKRLPDASQFAVSAFHVVEHIPFDALHVVASEAMRVLRPGGLLILETPNPESLIVSSTDFYLDPSHDHPIPPKLLGFLAEFHGFTDIKILRLQERRDLSPSGMSLWGVLTGTSPDYALIARKPGASVTEEIAAPYRDDYGVTLESLAIDFDIALRTSLSQSRERLEALDAAFQDARSTLATLQADFTSVKERQASTDAVLRDLLQSRSWRITRPLRWIAQQLRMVRDIVSPPRPAETAVAEPVTTEPASAREVPQKTEPIADNPTLSARARDVLREVKSDDGGRSTRTDP